MIEKFNNAIFSIKNLEPFDWLIVFVFVVILLATSNIYRYLQTLFYKYILGLEICKWIKGWKNIEK